MNYSSLGEALARVTQQQADVAEKYFLNGEHTDNEIFKKLFSNINEHCSSIGHSNEAATSARQNLFLLWHYFGAPLYFVTFTPCNEYSFCVRMYATSTEHKFPIIYDVQDESKFLLDFNLKKKLRGNYAGVCATEYKCGMQVVVRILICWNNKE